MAILRRTLLFFVCLLVPASAWQSDNGDGTFTNPVLYADYSDPDITRVGTDFYMVSSFFVTSPGLVVLKSKDMVNWEFAGHAASPVGTSDDYNMTNPPCRRCTPLLQLLAWVMPDWGPR